MQQFLLPKNRTPTLDRYTRLHIMQEQHVFHRNAHLFRAACPIESEQMTNYNHYF